ncbi:MAG: bifunctional nuclease family protein [Planctomycetota bacterium]
MADSLNSLAGDESRPSRTAPLFFGLTLVAATLIYVVTKHPVAAAILPCLHGGWNTLRTGFWILRVDPSRCRARVCFAFYLAAACWKSAAAAIISIMLLTLVEEKLRVQPNMNELVATGAVVGFGIVLNMFLGLGAIGAALAYKVRVWVHPRLLAVTRGELRSVGALTPLQRGFNHAIFVVVTAIVFPLLVALGIAIADATVGKNPQELEKGWTALFVMGSLAAIPLVMIPCYAWLSSRIIAQSPAHCWPELARGPGCRKGEIEPKRVGGKVMRCTYQGCENVATFHVAYIAARRVIREEHLCEEHAHGHLTAYAADRGIGEGKRYVLRGAKCFDIDLIVISECHDQQVVYLREVGGEQAIPILIGIFEATVLHRRLLGYESPRPLTHDATAMIIRTLGAQVEDVLIDAFEHHCYHAKLRMRRGNDLFSVDIRPSDAFVIALAFDSPIFFTDDVMAQLRAAGME